MILDGDLVNPIEAQVTGPRYFVLNGTGHASHQEQASTIAGTSSGATTTPTTNGSSGRPVTRFSAGCGCG
jgi:hypothetical protein